ncbi:histidine kinase [Undibacterium cyanobacteriorum]|uniref:Histidine kinase n=1 Tax=Undibacterium cyanobacteriorum TaxID=3073561 RepID=A0ABY9RK40_9BURK|nr:histidine kinase [Undibacterium sp. 20NA77.5]WMW81590.1 histidine kinase [Undibacterium sp. 20NA77.5]
MNPLLSNFRATLYNSIIWALLGALFAALLVLIGSGTWLRALSFTLPLALCFGFISSSAYYVCRALPLERRKFLAWLSYFGVSAVLSAGIWLSIANFWHQALQSVDFALDLPQNTWWIAGFLAALLYILSILIYDVLLAFDSMRQAELRQAASDLHAREAELQMLRTQINPHFLFNSLNSISALTSIDPASARDMTIELAQFFRQTLALSDQQKILLKQELQLCQHFLAIEKIRFGSKLSTEFVIDPDSELCSLPPMILQPLLENAIKHGIRDLSEGGTIKIYARCQDDWLQVAIENPIDASSPQMDAKQGTGTGLKNLRARFHNLYGNRCRVEWQKNEQHFRVELTLPREVSTLVSSPENLLQ